MLMRQISEFNHGASAFFSGFAFLIFGVFPARADGPLALEVSQQGAYESNVLRAGEGRERSSPVSTSGLDVKFDQNWGRQHLQGGAGWAHQEFFNQDFLTNDPYGLNAELDWSAANLLEGELGGDHRRQLFVYSQVGDNSDRNIEELSRAWFRVRKGVVTKLTLEGGVNAFDRRFSSDSTGGAQRYIAGQGGFRYQSSPDLSGRTTFRYTRGVFPERTANGDDYIRRDVEVGVDWKPSGASSLEAHLSAGRESHSLTAVQSVDVWAAGLSWRWQALGKLGLSLSLNRDSDTGSSTTFIVSDGAQVDLGNVGNTRTSTSASAGVAWAATSKIKFSLRGRVTRRALDSRRSGTDGVNGGDLQRGVDIGVLYRPLRSLDLSCSVALERRSILGNVGNLSFAYDSKSAQCGVALWVARK
ncbi:MAG: hypothetical protein Q8M37_10810 [Nevskia sp.]|nr:hypothetical protein [Nevskia sp.]